MRKIATVTINHTINQGGARSWTIKSNPINHTKDRGLSVTKHSSGQKERHEESDLIKSYVADGEKEKCIFSPAPTYHKTRS
jgi:hypothetical protein